MTTSATTTMTTVTMTTTKTTMMKTTKAAAITGMMTSSTRRTWGRTMTMRRLHPRLVRALVLVLVSVLPRRRECLRFLRTRNARTAPSPVAPRGSPRCRPPRRWRSRSSSIAGGRRGGGCMRRLPRGRRVATSSLRQWRRKDHHAPSMMMMVALTASKRPTTR